MEYQLEASFLHQCYNVGGARTAPFGPIAASGPNNPVLHYGHAGAPNDRQIQDGDLCLMDMGCTYYQYGSDITATWPANGKFTDRQRQVYNAVLRALQTVNARIKPGVPWTELHDLSIRTILDICGPAAAVCFCPAPVSPSPSHALYVWLELNEFVDKDHPVGPAGCRSYRPVPLSSLMLQP
eukprot:gene3378-13414_t